MLRMDQVHVIRHQVLIEGRSQRSVSREHGVSRNTVRKYVEVSEPAFKRPAKQRRRPVTEAIRPRLEELIEDWSNRQTKKQRITGSRLHDQLVTENFEVSETTVRILFREWKRKQQEVFVPLVHRPGDSAQVDFFEITVEVGAVRQKAWMFVMRLMHSGKDFAWIYERQDQVAFLDGHVRAFAHFGGVPGRCVYDNLSAAVKRVQFPGRDLTARFMALVSHYLFEPCFARVGTGHDKGGVEARGKGIRLQHLVPIPRGESTEEIAATLLEKIERQALKKRDKNGHTVAEKFVEEAKCLRPLPLHAFEPRLVVTTAASRKALVVIARETYSLPSHWQSLDVTAYVGATDVRFVCREEIVQRARPRPKEANIQYRDYLGELSRKPQAVRQVAPELLAELGAPWKTLWQLLESTHGGREAGRLVARLLAAIVAHGEGVITGALDEALEGGASHLKELTQLPSEVLSEIEIPEELRQYVVESASAADYDELLADEVAS